MALSNDFSGADEALLLEVVREAELYLNGQLTASIAADQRAIAFTGLLAAATVVIAGAGGALLISNPSTPLLAWPCIGIACGLALAMYFAIRSAMPQVFFLPGNNPFNWAEDAKANKSVKECMPEQIAHYDDMINRNNYTMERNGQKMARAVWTAWVSLTIGGAICILVLLGAIRLT